MEEHFVYDERLMSVLEKIEALPYKILALRNYSTIMHEPYSQRYHAKLSGN